MKNKVLLFGALAVMLSACSSEDLTNNNQILNTDGLSFSANSEPQSEPQSDGISAKSVLNGKTVEWVTNDAVVLFDNAGKKAELLAKTSGTSARFAEPATPVRDEGFDENNPAVVMYPYQSGATYDGTYISFSLPSSQTYVANSFAQDANVAVGAYGASVNFKNVCGLLKLQLMGGLTVKSITVTSEDKLWGDFKTTVSALDPVMEAVGEASTDEKTLTLNCGDDGVELNYSTATPFYFVVPVGALKGAFTVTVTTVNELTDPITFSASASGENKIERSIITAMPEKQIFCTLPSEYQQVEYLQSSGAQYIDTDFSWNNTLEYYIKLSVDEQPSGTHSFFGAYNGWSTSSKNCPLISTYNGCKVANNFIAGYSNGAGSNLGISNGQTGVISLVGNNISWSEGTSTTFDRGEDFVLTCPIYLFAVNTGGGASECVTNKFYFAYFLLNGNYVRKLIPCYRKSDSKPGMYDLVSGEFFINKGTRADFTVGPAVE